MTVADMGVITAEVQVDETDIVNVKIGQAAEVTIDAMPNQIFKGSVTEIGDNAIIRSTGVSTSQSLAGSQEAKSTAGQSRVVADFEDLQWGPVPNPYHDLGVDLIMQVRDRRRFDRNAVAIAAGSPSGAAGGAERHVTHRRPEAARRVGRARPIGQDTAGSR